MITRIELKNFMSHEHTVIEPSRGLTVISGPNNCGKSAIVTALQILCYNDDSTFVTRHGEKECSITVFTDDGHEIEWQRPKNKSTKYIIDGQQYDRLGRGGTPDVLYDILKIQRVDCDNQDFDVHFGAQKQPVFLLNDSPRAAAQFFASSSDANNLIAMQTLHKQKIRDNKSTKNRLAAELSHTEQRLETLETVPEILEELKTAETQYKQILSSDEEVIALNTQLMAIREHEKQQTQLAVLSQALESLNAPPELTPIEPLERLVTKTQQTQTLARRSETAATALQKLNSPPLLVETDELAELINLLQTKTSAKELASRAAENLQDVPQPPEFQPETPLRNAVTRLQNQQRRLENLDSLLQAAGQLAPPPMPKDFSGLDELVQTINDQRGQLDALQSQAVENEGQLDQLKITIEQWVAENPACPTCGGVLTAKKVLDPTGAGCHE